MIFYRFLLLMVCTKRHTKNSLPTSSSLYIVKEFVCCTIKPKSTSLSLRLFESRHRSNRKPLSIPRLTRFPEWFAKKWMTTHSVDFSKENTLRLRSTLICQKYASSLVFQKYISFKSRTIEINYPWRNVKTLHWFFSARA